MLVLNYLFELKIEGFDNLGTMEKEGGGGEGGVGRKAFKLMFTPLRN